MKQSLHTLLSIAGATRFGSLLAIVFTSIVFLSCEVDDIPETDTDPPEFTFTLRGPGINRTFTPRDNFEEFQVNLLAGEAYSFTFLGADAGGVRKIWLRAPSDYLNFADLATDVVREDSGFTTTISKAGDFAAPMTGLTITGTVHVIGEALAFPSIYIEVQDFATPINVTSATLQIGIVDDPNDAGIL